MRILPRAAARVLRRECVAERVAHALGRVLERLELLHHRQRIERRGRPGLDVGDPFFEVRCRLRATGDAAPAGAEHEGQAYRERAADEVVRHAHVTALPWRPARLPRPRRSLPRRGSGRISPYRRARGWSWGGRSEEHTSELQSLMRISYAVFCSTTKKAKSYYNRTHLLHTHTEQ